MSSMEIEYILTTLEDLVKVPLATSETKQVIAELVLTTLPESGIILRAHDYLIIFLSSQDPQFIKSLVERADPFYLKYALCS